MGTTIALKNIIGGMQLFVDLVFKDLPQNRFYCSHKLFRQHAWVCGFGLGPSK
jgi:hypothetical protein